jgi:hypothetical protein
VYLVYVAPEVLAEAAVTAILAPSLLRASGRMERTNWVTGHVWRILRALGWSPQRPARRARERHAEAVREWMARRWPAVKKTPDGERLGSDSKTRAGSASSRRTWAPRGQTRVLIHSFNWKKMSVAAALAHRVAGGNQAAYAGQEGHPDLGPRKARVGRNSQLCFAFLHHAGVSFLKWTPGLRQPVKPLFAVR